MSRTSNGRYYAQGECDLHNVRRLLVVIPATIPSERCIHDNNHHLAHEVRIEIVLNRVSDSSLDGNRLDWATQPKVVR